MSNLLSIGVLIASYKRPADLLRCLDSLKSQNCTPDDVVVVLRHDDLESHHALDFYQSANLPIRRVAVHTPGLVAARNTGIEASTTDVVAMIDDDTVPQPEWLCRVVAAFAENPSLGGLGGRDRCFVDGAFDDRQRETVGKLQWFGRTIGNHHLGFGSMREVDLLKGANMSYRRKALEDSRCDTRLRGLGAQSSEDISLCVSVKKNGWKLAYDPLALVHHYAGERSEERHYSGVGRITNVTPFRDFNYNEVVGLWGALTPLGRLAFFVWSLLVGTRVAPGLLQAIRFTPTLRGNAWLRFVVAQQGKMGAFRDLTFALFLSKSKGNTHSS
ncbi:glycosyltransferase [Granulicella tundricola]|uniref:Glycosyl transferase family 2 n=1 Tax=Granulicella tundricola (strain ATCC BAA-1859 / DSM 23138 / MP5ACTX9) TaxID=1198114 RepID=E8X7Q6_GRATM|nr:glycosyltransferase family 2 protein [Granulicella tundricola]ADW71490.1 glycosyl transferase family 2 [Granulicella tundricola MP5ACTX9]